MYFSSMKKILFIIGSLPVLKLAAQSAHEMPGIKLVNSITCSPVQDQYMSSTCWSFAGNSFLESELLLKNRQQINLSEMFVARYSYINKVYQYLAQNGKTFFTPGGQFHDIVKVIKEYGIVPETVYNGKPHGESNHNHAKLDTFMLHFADKLLRQKKNRPSAGDLVYMDKILDQWLGKVPETFVYKGRSYTPLSFTKDVLQFNADDYIELTSYTHHPFYKYFVLEDKYNWTKDNYYNVQLDDLMQISDSALANGYTVCWDGDVTETGFMYETGIAELRYAMNDAVKERQKTYENKSSTIDHMMQVTGTAADSRGQKWYYLKNSWGDYSNALGGYLYMQEDYFKIKTIAIIVNKKAIPATLRKKMNL